MAKRYSLLGQQAIEMLQDPAFAEQYTKGYLKGQALAQTVGETPMQPEVTAAAIQPEPQYIEPASTTYTGFTDQPMPDMPPQMAMAPDMPPQVPMQPSVFDEMQSAKSPKEQQRLLFKLMSQSMEQQQAGVRQAQEALKKEQERQAGLGVLGRLDLRPFAEALRSYGSTSVAQAQAPEMTEAQRQEFLRRLQAQVQDAQEGMTKEQVLALRTMMQERDAKSNMQALLSMGNQEMRAYENVARKFQKPQDQLLDFYQRHDSVKRAFDSGNITSIQTALSQYSRMTGETGALAVSDITRIMPDNLKLRAAQWWSKVASDPTVKAPEGVVEILQKNIGYLKGAAEQKYKSQLEVAKNQALKSAPAPYRKFAQPLYDESMQLLKSSDAEAGESPLLTPEQRSRLDKLKEKYRKNK